MRSVLVSVFCGVANCLLVALPLLAQSAPPPAAPPFGDPAAYLAQQFGPSFKLDPSIPPMFGDLDGEGKEGVVLVGTSNTPLLSQEQFSFKVEDPYDAYFGTKDPRITSQFTLHFDGSSRCLLIVFGWRSPQAKSKAPAKFVLINTPFESAKLVPLRFKKKNIQAIEVVDRSTLHSLLFWTGKRWIWAAQGMEGDDSMFKMPPPN
ncbi:MAG: hypothetical protein ABSD13_00295 [Candidatus Korobacteraceae bacterium]|jgi:hypothetical protein